MNGRHAVAIPLVAGLALGFVAACGGADGPAPPTTVSETELGAPKRALRDPRQFDPLAPGAGSNDPGVDDGEGESRGNGGGGGSSGPTVSGSTRLPK
jgi:hypothetical protein